MSIISIKNLSYKYPIGKEDSLHNINVNLEKGKLYALIGENGGGKTTLCNVLRGFIPHFHKGDLRGEILIKGKDVSEWDLGDLGKEIGFVFQNPFTQISGIKDTVFEEVAFGLENLGVDEDVIRENVEEVLELLGITYLKDKDPSELSGGQKQRIAFASIIVMDPEILIIDEPTSQLDPQGTEEVFKIIQIMKDKGKTIVLVEHKIELIAEYADYIIHLKDGEVVSQGEKREILTDKRTLEMGGELPQYALLGLELAKQKMTVDEIPITENEALALAKKILE